MRTAIRLVSLNRPQIDSLFNHTQESNMKIVMFIAALSVASGVFAAPSQAEANVGAAKDAKNDAKAFYPGYPGPGPFYPGAAYPSPYNAPGPYYYGGYPPTYYTYQYPAYTYQYTYPIPPTQGPTGPIAASTVPLKAPNAPPRH
ncbi:uncharacterized protein PGTG_12482 [Puccinia graminis f. sp. tritici CRL 75-36-700-3]|uniref:Uncharacterized protein n=2 Tax=Puccinia graminis f. sp. tritici (strain CRL 75-36-700-3 / race SCCL) TaxID=418459 RepID=E3KQF1_PUCGT|nr:uncharacterized protein PGTG_12482 [Puccinia graminis f. sp. tritici CRL 75-36-700-3]EFP86526.2 hypothetical protein PGTG_12482 [Puccinia graminis f. sp. tritici CRL 75-36-700-3]